MMNKVIFELKDGTKKEFDGEKFTDKQVTAFNTGDCFSIPCIECPFNIPHCIKVKGFSINQVARCYRVTTEEPKPVQILKRLIEGGSVWVYGDERKLGDVAISSDNSWYNIGASAVTLEKPKKKIRVERWINIYPSGNVGIYESKESADKWATKYRIACEHFVKEYEV